MGQQQNQLFFITMFHKIEESLQSYELELAQREALTVLEKDPKNLYARAIEKRLSRIIELHKKKHHLLRYRCAPVKRTIKALRHLCRLVVDKMLKHDDAEKEQPTV